MLLCVAFLLEGVNQWGVLIAINYAARAAGVRRGDSDIVARKK
jgi:nucleotidyltransferase/DNA polymerase involved in DNA repair